MIIPAWFLVAAVVALAIGALAFAWVSIAAIATGASDRRYGLVTLGAGLGLVSALLVASAVALVYNELVS